jgi:hypothetical protein
LALWHQPEPDHGHIRRENRQKEGVSRGGGGHWRALGVHRVSVLSASFISFAPRWPSTHAPGVRDNVQYERREAVSSTGVDTQTSSDAESEVEVREEEGWR